MRQRTFVFHHAFMSVSTKSPAAARKVTEATAPIEATSPVQPRTSSAPLSVGIATAFERFLEMPVAFVLGVVWVAGVALMGSCALVLYLAVSALI
jgi:hypothetical protein